MTPAEQSTMCVTSFLWDARVDLAQAIRRLDATVNRLGDDALTGTEAAVDAARVKELADQLAAIREQVTGLYSKWNHTQAIPFQAA